MSGRASYVDASRWSAFPAGLSVTRTLPRKGGLDRGIVLRLVLAGELAIDVTSSSLARVSTFSEERETDFTPCRPIAAESSEEEASSTINRVEGEEGGT